MAETDISNQQSNEGVDTSTPIMDIFYITLRRWPWILLSIFICLAIGALYILSTPKVYTRSAEILIKEQDKGKSASLEDFSELGFLSGKTNVIDEVSTIQSKDLIKEVADRLKLDYNIYKKGTFHDNILYGSSLPVKVDIDGVEPEIRLEFDMNITPEGAITISGIEMRREKNKMEFEDVFEFNMNDTIETVFGHISVHKNPNFYTKKSILKADEEEIPEAGSALDLKVLKLPVSRTCESLSKRLKVSQKEKTGNVINLTITDQSRQRADDILSSLIGVYNESWIRDKNQIAVSTSNFINERLGVIESELGNVDSDISSFKSEHLVPDVDAASSLYMNESQKTASAIVELNNQLQMIRYIRSYLSAENSLDQLLPANSGEANSTLATQISEYNKTVLQRNDLIKKSSDRNALVKSLAEQLDAQRKAIIHTVDNQIVDIQTQIKGLQRSEAQTISRIASSPTQAKYLLSVERQQKVKESLYLFLLQKREDNELSQAFTAYNTRVIMKPGSAGVPPTPNRLYIMLIAFIIGVAIPFGVTYVKEISNTKVRGRKDLERLSLPFLGEIPLQPGAEKKSANADNKLAVREGNRNIVNEAFRVLRTNLEFMRPHDKDEAYVLAMTSFNPGSGKSYITMNLGQALALKGKHVLIVDGDLRHGSASSYIGSPSRGLSDYLNGAEKDLSSLIKSVGESKNLSIIPTGIMPPNPAELLESKAFPHMLNELRKAYDYIIVDCPPIEIVADAHIINRYVDRTVFVIRAGLFERNMLGEIEKLYQTKKYNSMSLILNGTTAMGGYVHGYRYGYHYGYGGHYGSEKD